LPAGFAAPIVGPTTTQAFRQFMNLRIAAHQAGRVRHIRPARSIFNNALNFCRSAGSWFAPRTDGLADGGC
jgi:hypothetical protein